MKSHQPSPEQIMQAIRNSRGDYERNERLKMLRHVARLWQAMQRGAKNG